MERFWPIFTDFIKSFVILLGPTLSPTQSYPASNTCLKLWPVHGHARPMCATPPAQIFFITGSLNALLQVSMEFMEPMRHPVRQGRPKPLELQVMQPNHNPEDIRGASIQCAGHTCHYWRGQGVDAG